MAARGLLRSPAKRRRRRHARNERHAGVSSSAGQTFAFGVGDAKGIKLGDVASDVLGASGKAMLRALCEGNADPVALAELAQGKLRRKIPALRAALEGHFSANHALLVSHLLSHIEYLDETIEQLSEAIEEQLRPFERKRELLCTIPGVAERTADVILAEFGPDMDRFPSHRHAASWAAICPGHDESAGKRHSGKTRKGDRWLRTALIEAAQSAAGRTKGTYLHSQYLRVKRRPRTQEGDRRRRPLDPRGRLLHPPRRSSLPGARRRLLRPPRRPGAAYQALGAPTRKARTERYARAGAEVR
jgi:transposase